MTTGTDLRGDRERNRRRREKGVGVVLLQLDPRWRQLGLRRSRRANASPTAEQPPRPRTAEHGRSSADKGRTVGTSVLDGTLIDDTAEDGGAPEAVSRRLTGNTEPAHVADADGQPLPVRPLQERDEVLPADTQTLPHRRGDDVGVLPELGERLGEAVERRAGVVAIPFHGL